MVSVAMSIWPTSSFVNLQRPTAGQMQITDYHGLRVSRSHSLTWPVYVFKLFACSRSSYANVPALYIFYILFSCSGVVTFTEADLNHECEPLEEIKRGDGAKSSVRRPQLSWDGSNREPSPGSNRRPLLKVLIDNSTPKP